MLKQYIRYPGLALAIMITLAFAPVYISLSSAQSVQAILVLVNDEPISAYDVKERVKLRLLGSQEAREMLKSKFQSQDTKDRFKEFMQAARPTSREEAMKVKDEFVKKLRDEVQNSIARKMQKSTLEELIDERLMLQEAQKQNVAISDEDVENRLKDMAGRNKNPQTGRPLTVKEFLQNLENIGVSERTFKARIKASIALQNVVIRKYGRRMQEQIGDTDVDRILASSGDTVKDTEFQLQKVMFSLPKNADQTVIAKRFLDAEVMRSKFTSCKELQALVKSVNGASVQSLGARTPAQLPKASRAVFLEAKSGEMTPPNITPEGIELYAVCSRRAVAGDDKQRAEVKNRLRQEEFQLLRRRYLRDLRQDAFIEYRSAS